MVEYIASIVNFLAGLEHGNSNPSKSKIRFHMHDYDNSPNFKAHHGILFKNLIYNFMATKSKFYDHAKRT